LAELDLTLHDGIILLRVLSLSLARDITDESFILNDGGIKSREMIAFIIGSTLIIMREVPYEVLIKA
jgi:hypothetical protein